MALNKKHVKGKINVSSLYQAMKEFISTADSNANPDKQKQSSLRESLIKPGQTCSGKLSIVTLKRTILNARRRLKNQGINQAHKHLLHMQTKRHF